MGVSARLRTDLLWSPKAVTPMASSLPLAWNPFPFPLGFRDIAASSSSA